MNKKNLTTFYIVRHGETDWNAQKKLQGQTDIPLNENGKVQAKNCAEKLKHIKFDLAFSSDLLRAKHTAEIIALEHKLEVQTTAVLRERNFGKLEGQPWEIVHTYFELMQKLTEQERYTKKLVEDAESDEEVLNRLLPFLKETALANPGKTILVVAHGGTLRMILLLLKYVTYEKLRKSGISNTAYIALNSDGEEFSITETNGFSNLE